MSALALFGVAEVPNVNTLRNDSVRLVACLHDCAFHNKSTSHSISYKYHHEENKILKCVDVFVCHMASDLFFASIS